MDTREYLIFLVIFLVWLMFAFVFLFLLFAQAKSIYATATEGIHRCRMEMMDKLIELERVKTVASSVTEPSLKPGKEAVHAKSPN